MDEFHSRSKAEYTEAIKRFPYPLEIVHGSDALSTCESIRASDRGTPIVMGDASSFTIAEELMHLSSKEHPSVELILDRSSEIEFPSTFRAMRDRDIALLKARYPDIGNEDCEPPIGEWPAEVSGSTGLTLAEHPVRGFVSRVHIAILPTKDSTAGPAFLRAGGWNDCPEAAVQVAALRSWRDRFGAELVGLGSDVMNIRVQRPPSSRDEALSLAREHNLFCSDALNDMNYADLAACLLNDDWWFFWWD
jgi:hypothetical protein